MDELTLDYDRITNWVNQMHGDIIRSTRHTCNREFMSDGSQMQVAGQEIEPDQYVAAADSALGRPCDRDVQPLDDHRGPKFYLRFNTRIVY